MTSMISGYSENELIWDTQIECVGPTIGQFTNLPVC